MPALTKKSSPDDTAITSEVPGTDESWLEIVDRQVNALKFGSVQITVHDGNVVQIETSMKVRFDRPPRERP